MPQHDTAPVIHGKRGSTKGARARAALDAYGIPGGPQSLQVTSDEEWEFCQAMERFKLETKNPFPSWSEALAILKGLGYHRRHLISLAEARALTDEDPVIWERIERGEVVDIPAGRIRRADPGATR